MYIGISTRAHTFEQVATLAGEAYVHNWRRHTSRGKGGNCSIPRSTTLPNFDEFDG